MNDRPGPMKFLVGILVSAAMPGIAFAGAPAASNVPPAPSAAPASVDDLAAPAYAAPAQAAPQPYAPPPPPAGPQGYPPPAPLQAYPPPGVVAPQGYPPPGAYPAYPPGYYPPAYPPSAPPAYFTAQRLVVLDAQIRDLIDRRDSIGFGGPVTLLIGGGVLGLAGLFVAGANDCTNDYVNAAYNTCTQSQEDAQGFGFLMVAAGATGIVVGLISMMIRKGKRGRLTRQIAARQLEADALRTLQPRWGVVPTRDRSTLSLAFNF